jgi:hypothetical protein
MLAIGVLKGAAMLCTASVSSALASHSGGTSLSSLVCPAILIPASAVFSAKLSLAPSPTCSISENQAKK